MTTALNLRLPSTAGSLESYFDAVNRVPLLTLEREQQLSQRYRDDDDIEAALLDLGLAFRSAGRQFALVTVP